MSQNGQTHFKNLAANAARFLKCTDHFGTLCIKGLRKLRKIDISYVFNLDIICKQNRLFLPMLVIIQRTDV